MHFFPKFLFIALGVLVSGSVAMAHDSSIDREADLMGPRIESEVLYRRELRKLLQKVPKQSPLVFSHACEPGKRTTLLAVGDVLLHQPLAVQGMGSSDGFRSLWSGVARELENVDITYGNLEGPTAGNLSTSGAVVRDPGRVFDGVAYTSYPMFNYHPMLPGDLKASGFDVVSTANNHALDRTFRGIDRTISALRNGNLPFTGTLVSTEVSAQSWTAYTNLSGLRLAWIACTFSTNGLPDPKRQVLGCYSQKNVLLNEIRKAKADRSVDAVIVTPHWGIEYETKPRAEEKKLAREMVEAGALIVFGGHPHVLQPVEKIVTSKGREAFVIYSLGNFVSGQTQRLSTRTAALLYLGLTRGASGEVFVNGVRHLPTTMSFSDGISVKPAAGNLEDSRTLANQILSGSRELKPGEAVVTNPDCP